MIKKRVWIPVLVMVTVAVTTAATAFKSDFFEIAKQIEIFTDAYKRINMEYVEEVDPAETMDVAITALFSHLDPYTNFWNAQEVQDARLNQAAGYSSIGANIQTDQEKIIVKRIFKNMPADKAGLKAGDEIVKIDGIDISQYAENAGDLLNGAPGSTVELTFKRQGKAQSVSLKRESIQRKLVPFHALVEDGIGYIKLTEFGETASQEVGDALKDLKSQGAEKIILDLRDNPGGLLGEAVNVANLFLPKDQLIVYTKSQVEKYNRTYLTQKQPLDDQIPVAVLVNGHSASASEIVAGSIQDLDRGIVIGGRSFGKGLVQRVHPLKYGTQMKLTISRYYTPSGRCIQALDYRHKNKDGKAKRTSQADYNEFKTKNGRSVYDGGGIAPDVAVETAEIADVTQALLEQNLVFDFATQYFYRHDIDKPEDFRWSDSDFNDFKSYLKKVDFNYQTQLEKDFEKAFAQFDNEEFKHKISEEYEVFKNRINQLKTKEIDENKSQIAQQLTHEILRRYFYEDGLYRYAVQHNPEIKKAVELFQSAEKYHKILNP